MKKRIFAAVSRVNRLLNVIAGAALVFVVALTSCDVILRSVRSPIPGTYEIVALCGAVIIIFALPRTTWMRSHIFVDFLIIRFPRRGRDAFNLFTRLLCIALFILFGLSILGYASDLARTGELTPILRFPFYPVVYAVGICCFVQCLVLVCDVVKIIGGEYE
jgi:TRAP-type C4-dicarboxylate transport system permease small subunit